MIDPRKILAAYALAVTVLLTGCGAGPAGSSSVISDGERCHDAGGWWLEGDAGGGYGLFEVCAYPPPGATP